MALGEAQVKITPDLGDFEARLVDGINSALSAASKAADKAASEIEGAFTGAADAADSALAEVDGDGFADATAQASNAAAQVENAFDGAASASDAALTDIDGDGFTEATSGAANAGRDIEKAFDEAGKKSQTVLNKIDFKQATIAAGAFIAAFGAGRALINAAEAAATANARIRQIATSMDLFGSEVGNVTERLIAYARETALATGVDQNAIKETQAKLLTFRELAATADQVGGAFDRATLAAVDLAAAGFGSAESNAVQLGKALQDPIRGLTALNRSGVTFTETEKERIRTLVESNDVMTAQSLILDAIETQVGGTAIATSNATDRMAVSFSIVKEELGEALLPALDVVASAMRSLLEMFTALPGPIKQVTVVTALAATGFIAASRAIQAVGVSAGIANKALGAIGLILTGATLLFHALRGSGEQVSPILEKIAEDADRMAAAMRRGEGATKTIGQQITETAVESEVMRVAMIQAGLGVDDLAAAVEGGKVESMQMEAALKQAAIAAGMTQEQANELTNDLVFMAIAHEEATVKAEQMGQIVNETGEEMDDAADQAIDYTSALQDVERQTLLLSTALRASADRTNEWRGQLESATRKGADAFGTFQIDAETSVEKFIEMLIDSAADIAAWQDNLLLIAQKTSPEFAGYLAEMGPAAAPVVAELARDGVLLERTLDAYVGFAEVTNRDFLGEFDGTAAGVERRLSDVKTAVDNALGPLAADARTRALAISDSIMQGLVDGINAGNQNLVYAAAGMVDTVVATAKDRAGIRSPSQVFADEVGAPMAQGVADGITNTVVQAKDAMMLLVDDLSTEALAGVDQFNDSMQDVLKSAQGAYDEVWDTIKGRRSQEAATKRVTDAENDLAEANDRVKGALQAEGNALAELIRVQNDGESTSKQIAEAQRNYERAQKDVTRATKDVERSTKSLQDANYALLQVSAHLLEQGPESIANYEAIARAAGLETGEIDKLVRRYLDLAAARKAAAEAAQASAAVDAEIAKGTQKSAVDSANQAVVQAVAERDKIAAAGKDPGAATQRAVNAAITAANAFAQSTGAAFGSRAYAQKQLDVLQFLSQGTPWLAAPLKGVMDSLRRQIGLANGAIVNGARFAMIGEAGPEAVIPLGRPSRAMQLMEQSGLADMVRGSGAAVQIQNATFATPSDADLVAQKVNAAYRARVLVG